MRSQVLPALVAFIFLFQFFPEEATAQRGSEAFSRDVVSLEADCYGGFDYFQPCCMPSCQVTFRVVDDCSDCPVEQPFGQACPSVPTSGDGEGKMADLLEGRQSMLDGLFEVAVGRLLVTDALLFADLSADVSTSASVLRQRQQAGAISNGTASGIGSISNGIHSDLSVSSGLSTCAQKDVCGSLTDFAYAVAVHSGQLLSASLDDNGEGNVERHASLTGLMEELAAKKKSAEGQGCPSSISYVNKVTEDVTGVLDVLEEAPTDETQTPTEWSLVVDEEGERKWQHETEQSSCIGYRDASGNFHPEECQDKQTGDVYEYHRQSKAQLKQYCLQQRGSFVLPSQGIVKEKLKRLGRPYMEELFTKLDRESENGRFEPLLRQYKDTTGEDREKVEEYELEVIQYITDELNEKLSEEKMLKVQEYSALVKWLTLLKLSEDIPAECDALDYGSYMSSSLPRIVKRYDKSGNFQSGVVDLRKGCRLAMRCGYAMGNDEENQLSGEGLLECDELRQWTEAVAMDLISTSGAMLSRASGPLDENAMALTLSKWLQDDLQGRAYEAGKGLLSGEGMCGDAYTPNSLSLSYTSSGHLTLHSQGEDGTAKQRTAQYRLGVRKQAVLSTTPIAEKKDDEEEVTYCSPGMEYAVQDGGRTKWSMPLPGEVPKVVKYYKHQEIYENIPISEDFSVFVMSKVNWAGKLIGPPLEYISHPLHMGWHAGFGDPLRTSSAMSPIPGLNPLNYNDPDIDTELHRISSLLNIRYRRSRLLFCSEEQALEDLANYFDREMIPELGGEGVDHAWDRLKASEIAREAEALHCHHFEWGSPSQVQCLLQARENVATLHNNDLNTPDTKAIAAYLGTKTYLTDRMRTIGANLGPDQYWKSIGYSAGAGGIDAIPELLAIGGLIKGMNGLKLLAKQEKVYKMIRMGASGTRKTMSVALLYTWVPSFIGSHIELKEAIEHGEYLRASDQVEPMITGWLITLHMLKGKADGNDRCKKEGVENDPLPPSKAEVVLRERDDASFDASVYLSRSRGTIPWSLIRSLKETPEIATVEVFRPKSVSEPTNTERLEDWDKVEVAEDHVGGRQVETLKEDLEGIQEIMDRVKKGENKPIHRWFDCGEQEGLPDYLRKVAQLPSENRKQRIIDEIENKIRRIREIQTEEGGLRTTLSDVRQRMEELDEKLESGEEGITEADFNMFIEGFEGFVDMLELGRFNREIEALIEVRELFRAAYDAGDRYILLDQEGTYIYETFKPRRTHNQSPIPPTFRHGKGRVFRVLGPEEADLIADRIRTNQGETQMIELETHASSNDVSLLYFFDAENKIKVDNLGDGRVKLTIDPTFEVQENLRASRKLQNDFYTVDLSNSVASMFKDPDLRICESQGTSCINRDASEIIKSMSKLARYSLSLETDWRTLLKRINQRLGRDEDVDESIERFRSRSAEEEPAHSELEKSPSREELREILQNDLKPFEDFQAALKKSGRQADAVEKSLEGSMKSNIAIRALYFTAEGIIIEYQDGRASYLASVKGLDLFDQVHAHAQHVALARFLFFVDPADPRSLETPTGPLSGPLTLELKLKGPRQGGRPVIFEDPKGKIIHEKVDARTIRLHVEDFDEVRIIDPGSVTEIEHPEEVEEPCDVLPTGLNPSFNRGGLNWPVAPFPQTRPQDEPTPWRGETLFPPSLRGRGDRLDRGQLSDRRQVGESRLNGQGTDNIGSNGSADRRSDSRNPFFRGLGAGAWRTDKSVDPVYGSYNSTSGVGQSWPLWAQPIPTQTTLQLGGLPTDIPIELTVLDALGRSVYKIDYQQLSENTIDVSSWPGGLYQLLATDLSSGYTQRLQLVVE